MERLNQQKQQTDKKQLADTEPQQHNYKQVAVASSVLQRQRQLQELIIQSPAGKGQAVLQTMADNSRRTKAGATIQAMADKSFVVQKASEQKKVIEHGPYVAAQGKRQAMLFPAATVQRKRQEAEEQALLKKEAAGESGAAETKANNKDNKTKLPDALKAGAESLSGVALDDVRVNFNSDMPATVQAHAYAQGTEIHLGPGQEKHLPHEAWHVVQQKQGRVQPTMQLKGEVPLNDDAGLEKEADVMGNKALTEGQSRLDNAREEKHVPFKFSSGVNSPVQQSRPVMQQVPIKVSPINSNGYEQDINTDTQDIYEAFKNRGSEGFAGFNPEIYPGLEAALIDAREAARQQRKDKDRHQIERMLTEIYNHDPSEFVEEQEMDDPDEEVFDDNAGELSDTEEMDTPPASQDKEKKRKTDTGEADEEIPLKAKKKPKIAIESESEGESDSQDKDGTAEANADNKMALEQEKADVKPKTGSIGIVSWNVAHFSDKDGEAQEGQKEKEEIKDEAVEEITDKRFKERLQAILEKFKQVKDEWNAFCKAVKGFIEKIRNPAKELKDPWKGIQDVEGTQGRLKTAVDTAENSLDVSTGLFEELQVFLDFDWNAAYDIALENAQEKVTLANKVKEFRNFGRDYVSNLSGAFSSVTKIWSTEVKATTYLNRIGGQDLKNLRDQKTALISKLNKAEIEELTRALHTRNVALQAEEMFKNNEWLDVMILQEVNNPTLLNQANGSYDLEKGPRMLSGGKNPQREYYTMLIKKGSGITVSNIYAVGTNGEKHKVEQEKSDDNNEESKYKDIRWDKKQKDFRPIIVYEIERPIPNTEQKEKMWIGVVHTTPEVDQGIAEFNRIKIYEEVEQALETLSNEAKENNIPLIIGGDYYLTAEAVVKKNPGKANNQDKRAIDEVQESTEEQFSTLKNEIEAFDALTYDSGELEKIDEEISRSEKKLSDGKKLTKNTEQGVREDLEKFKEEKKAILIKHNVASLEEFQKRIDAEMPLQEERRKRLKMLEETRSPDQILRNTQQRTAGKQIESKGLAVTQPVSGTNPKEAPLKDWDKLQIADFYVSSGMETGQAGIMRPEGKMVTIDAEDLRYSKYWQHFSDHFPVGGVFSVHDKDSEAVVALLNEAFVLDEKAEETSQQLNIDIYAYQFVREKLRSLKGNMKKEEEEKWTKQMTGKAYLHKIQTLESKYGNLPKYDPGEDLDEEAVIEHFKKICSLINATDPAAKITPPGYDDYVSVYLKDLNEKDTSSESADVETFNKSKVALALKYLEERLKKLSEKIQNEHAAKDAMQVEKKEGVQPGWDDLLLFIVQIQELEQKLIAGNKMEKNQALTVIRPQDIEPESIDPAFQKDKKPEQNKPKSDKPEKPAVPEDIRKNLEVFYSMLHGKGDFMEYISQHKADFRGFLPIDYNRILQELTSYLLSFLMDKTKHAVDVIELLTTTFKIPVDSLISGIAGKIDDPVAFVMNAGRSLVQLRQMEYLDLFIPKILPRINGGSVLQFTEILRKVYGHEYPGASIPPLLARIALKELKAQDAEGVMQMLLEAGWMNADQLQRLKASPEEPSAKKNNYFPDDADAMQRGYEESLTEQKKQEAFEAPGRKIGLDKYMDLHNAPGTAENCLIYSITRALKANITEEKITETGQRIRKDMGLKPDAPLDTRSVLKILELLGLGAKVIIIDTEKKPDDPESKNRDFYIVEIFDQTGKEIFIVNANNLHFGYATIKSGLLHRIVDGHKMYFEKDNGPVLNQDEIRKNAKEPAKKPNQEKLSDWNDDLDFDLNSEQDEDIEDDVDDE